MKPSEKDNQFIVALSAIPEIGPARFRALQEKFPSFEAVWHCSAGQLAKLAGFSEELAQKVVSAKQKIDPGQQRKLLEKNEITLLTADDELYPSLLGQISSAPFALFCQGDPEILGSSQLGVVGTRLPTQYGKTATEKIVGGLVEAGLTITSGMAQGVDSVAHLAACKDGGKTVAVLGAGIIANAKNSSARSIADKIISCGGVVVSEYHPLVRATKFTFPARNRIIAGLAKGVLVVEAGEKSGSLITANLALENNREIFAVPGSIFSRSSLGANALLKQGAHLASEAKDILQVLGFAIPQGGDRQISFASKQQEEIYNRLSYEPILIDQLSRKSALESAEISAILSLLELQGLAKNIGGGRFIRK